MEDVAKAAAQPSRAPLVLLVEDEILIRLTSGELLRDAGFTVVEAADGEEAVALLDAGLTPALIVSDIRMPGAINGLKLAELVQERYPSIPMLFASSHIPVGGIPGDKVAFLPKPYTAPAIIEAAQGLIGDT
jgi:CheY-like chemotaxis protein